MQGDPTMIMADTFVRLLVLYGLQAAVFSVVLAVPMAVVAYLHAEWTRR